MELLQESCFKWVVGWCVTGSSSLGKKYRGFLKAFCAQVDVAVCISMYACVCVCNLCIAYCK